MPEEDIAIPGVGRRLLIFIVTLLLCTATRIAVLLHVGSVALHVRRGNTAKRGAVST